MKTLFFALVVIFMWAVCQAQENPENNTRENHQEKPFTPEEFKKGVKTALLEMNDDLLIKNLSYFLRKKRESFAPDCFECSFFLLKETASFSESKKLIAADFAVKFSPDLPESYIYKFGRQLDYNPFDIGSLFESVKGYIISSLNFPFRDHLLFSIFDFIKIAAVLILSVMFLVMLCKYYDLVWHLFIHFTGGSFFYGMSAVIIYGFIAFYSIKAGLSWMFVFLPMSFVFYKFMKYREFFLISFFLALFFTAESMTYIFNGKKAEHYTDSFALVDSAFNYFPQDIPASLKDSQVSVFSKGASLFYMNKYTEAEPLLEKASEGLKDPVISAAARNMLGIIYHQKGDLNGARKIFLSAYRDVSSAHIAFNLSKILYEMKENSEAQTIETNILSRSKNTRFEYPMVFMPDIRHFNNAVLSEKSSGSGEPIAKPVYVYLLALIFTILMLFIIYNSYIEKFNLVRCVECGTIICENCAPSNDAEICIPCKLIKASRDIFTADERAEHDKNKKRHFGIRHGIAMALSIFTPGGGLLYKDRIIEGFIYLCSCTVFVVFYLECDRIDSMILSYKMSELWPVLFITAAVFIHVFSFVRVFSILRHE